MSRTHFTQHGTRLSGDALDVFGDEVDVLRSLFDAWSATTPRRDMGGQAVPAKWDHGTIGKLLLEHGAVHLAAREDVVRVLQEAGQEEAARQLAERIGSIRPVVDRMDEASRGLQPMSLAITPAFVEAAGQLHAVLRDELEAESGEEAIARLARALGEHRPQLRSAKFIRKHAPSHPGPPRWYDRIPILVRFHSGYDRMRGFPWGESSLGHTELAERYDREA